MSARREVKEYFQAHPEEFRSVYNEVAERHATNGLVANIQTVVTEHPASLLESQPLTTMYGPLTMEDTAEANMAANRQERAKSAIVPRRTRSEKKAGAVQDVLSGEDADVCLVELDAGLRRSSRVPRDKSGNPIPTVDISM